jgi:hypothetical protein
VLLFGDAAPPLIGGDDTRAVCGYGIHATKARVCCGTAFGDGDVPVPKSNIGYAVVVQWGLSNRHI